MLTSPKIKKILGITLLILVGAAAFILTKTDLLIPQKSEAALTASQNKFALDFKISQKDKIALDEIAKKLSLTIPTSKVEFELDTTSSAKLAFKTPVIANFSAKSNQINFDGELKGPQPKLINQESFKVPESTLLAVFSNDLKGFVTSKLTFNKEVEDWFNKTFTDTNGQYLIVFTGNTAWALTTKNPEADLLVLTTLTDTEAQPIYKEEMVDDVTLGLLNVKTKDAKDTTIGVFKIGENVYLVQTPEAAKELIKSQNKTIDFKLPPTATTVSLNVLFTNKNRELPESFYALFALDKNRLEKYLNNIEKLEFTQKENKFSGLILVR